MIQKGAIPPLSSSSRHADPLPGRFSAVARYEPLEVQWSTDTSCLATDSLLAVNQDHSLLPDLPQPGFFQRQFLRDVQSSPSLSDPLFPLLPSKLLVHLPQTSPLKLLQLILGAATGIFALARLYFNRRRRARRSPFLVGISHENVGEGWASKVWSSLRRDSESDLSLGSIS